MKRRPWDLDSWWGVVFPAAVAFGIVCTVTWGYLKWRN